MKVKLASLIIGLLYIPIIWFLYYKILEHIKATEVMWFLYWMCLPMAFIIAILSKLAEWEEY